MLNTLRKKLAIICMLITATILSGMSFFSLVIYEKQFYAQQNTLLENHLSNLVFRLQTEKSISHTFLAELETNNHLIVSIEDNKKPLLYRGNTHSITPRRELIRLAKDLATTKYHFNLSSFYISTMEVPKVIFELRTKHQEHYLVTVSTFSATNGYFTLVLLKDMSQEDQSILLTRLLFILLTIIGFILLGVFSFLFAGHAIKPIEQSQKKQTEFISAASHELRSPLAVIDTNTSALRFEKESINAHFTDIIRKECHRMKHLVDDLLLLATTDAHNWSINLCPTEVDTLLIEVYETFLNHARKKNFIFNIVLPEEMVPSIQVDRERLQQTLTILLDNAFSYTPHNGKISLVLSIEKDYLKIDVIDNGPGISDAHKPLIFDRFYRIDPSRHEKEHYGLGLSIAFEMIRLHKGKLTLKDTPGGGCTFSILLPRHKEIKNTDYSQSISKEIVTK